MNAHRWCMLPGSVFNAGELEASLAWQEEVSVAWGRDLRTEVRWVPDWSDPWRVGEILASLAAQSVADFRIVAGIDEAARARIFPEFQRFAGSDAVRDLGALCGFLGLADRMIWTDPSDAAARPVEDEGVLLLASKNLLHPMALFSIAKERAISPRRELLWFLEALSDRTTGGPHAVRFRPGPGRYSVLGGPGVSDSLWVSRAFWTRFAAERLGKNAPSDRGWPVWPLAAAAVEWRAEVGRIAVALVETVHPRGKPLPGADDPGESGAGWIAGSAASSGAALARWHFDPRRGAGVPEPLPVVAPLAAVVPFRDQEQLTASTFRSLASQSVRNRVRLVALDNGSRSDVSDRLRKLADSLFGSDRVVWLGIDAPFNFAELNNRGVASCGEEHLLFLNNDVEFVDVNAVERLQSYLAWPEVGMAGGALFYPDGSLQAAGIRFGAAGPEVVRDPDSSPMVFREVDALTFACVACRRDAFEAAGRLDEVLCPNGFGDALIGHRMRAAGWRMLVDPSIGIIHHESRSRGIRPEEIERSELSREGIPMFLYGTEWVRQGQDTLQRFGRTKPTVGKRIYRAVKAARRELFG